MKHCFLLGIAILQGLFLAAQTQVTHYQPGVTESGITYFLPQTRLHITLTAEKNTYTPGEYAAYAERYLRLKDVPQMPYDEWSITGVTITPYGTADSTQAYSIAFKAKTTATLVGLAADGRLLSIHAEAPSLPLLSQPGIVKKANDSPTASDYKTREILAAGSTTKMAELAANEIYDIRENRSLLAKGQADFMPKDGEQLRLMLQNLDRQETALLQLFKGTTTTEIHTLTLDFTPTTETDKTLLFRFSKYLGLVEKDDLSGEPYYISVKDLHSLPLTVEAAKPSKETNDLCYIVPGNALVKIYNSAKEFASLTTPLAQFGRVEHLGGDLFNKKNTTSVLLSPETGGIVKLDALAPQ